MLITDEAKRIGEILFHGGPKTTERINFICREIAAIPDAIRVNIESVREHLIAVQRDINDCINCEEPCTRTYDFENPLNSIG
jgi:hypothetical protein